MNHLHNHEHLKNTYFALRHGKSEANEQEIILSNPTEGVSGYGLTEDGTMQVKKSVETARSLGMLDDSTLIFSSDFLRTKQTADIAVDVLGAAPAILTTKLRERYFGEWEKTHNSNYEKVWADDSVDAAHRNARVESAEDVVDRVTKFIEELESTYEGRKILLVSHGDALQLLQTAFEKVSPSVHRSLPHLATAEIRQIS